DRARRGAHGPCRAGSPPGPAGGDALLRRPHHRRDRGGPPPFTGHHQAGVDRGEGVALPRAARQGGLVTPERWEAVKRLFHEAREAAEGRTAYLERACAGDVSLRKEVETLLSSERQAGGFLEEPAAAAAPPA